MAARLTVIAGNAQPTICELLPDSIIRLGRKGSNHVVLKDQHASREHAELYFHESKRWFIRDCPEITNPTRINGRKIDSPTRLEHGQVIAIGEARLQFTEDSSTESMPALTDEPVSESTTMLQADELETLVGFLMAAPNVATAPALVQLAL
jgi:pSer/pThr/pTyr-binding forkhead associated (FHA) protein